MPPRVRFSDTANLATHSSKQPLCAAAVTATATSRKPPIPPAARGSGKAQETSEPSVSPSSNSSAVSPNTAAAVSGLDEYVRDLRATIAEQRRHLDIARMGLEKERGARTELAQRVQQLEAQNTQMRREIASRVENERGLRELCEELRAQVSHLHNAVSAQQDQTAEVTVQRDVERRAAAELRGAYEKLKSEFDANERVFQELLGALRDMEREKAALFQQQQQQRVTRGETAATGGHPPGRARPANNAAVVEFADQQHPADTSAAANSSNISGSTLGNAVWMTAWRQLKQRRHFDEKEPTAEQQAPQRRHEG